MTDLRQDLNTSRHSGYPRTLRIGDGAESNSSDDVVELRIMAAADPEADRVAIAEFARSLPELDLLFQHTDITRDDVVDRWLLDIEQNRTVTLLAESGGRLIGYASLHHSENLWTRHLGEIMLLLNEDYRGRGIGGQIARHILELAKNYDHLQKLVAQMMSSQRHAQQLFHHLGFIPEAMLHDWVIDRAGRTHDLIMMSREVDLDEDFFAPLPT